MASRMQALRLMFRLSDTVFCECGYNLTYCKNIAKLARCGCPRCGSKRFDFNVTNEEAQKRLRGVLNVSGS